MRPIDAYGGSDERSLDADNTAAFNCRYAVAPGPKRWSVHAYGLAVDVDPVENPYLEGGRVHPRAGARVPRPLARPARAWPSRGGLLVRAFARGRLAVGRPLDRLARLPALLGDRRLMDVAPPGVRDQPAAWIAVACSRCDSSARRPPRPLFEIVNFGTPSGRSRSSTPTRSRSGRAGSRAGGCTAADRPLRDPPRLGPGRALRRPLRLGDAGVLDVRQLTGEAPRLLAIPPGCLARRPELGRLPRADRQLPDPPVHR